MRIKLNKEYKQYLRLIIICLIKNHNYRKTNCEYEWEKRFLKKRRKEEKFWDKFEELQSEYNLQKFNIKDSSFIEPSSNENNIETVKNLEDKIYESLEDKDRGIELKDKNYSFNLV